MPKTQRTYKLKPTGLSRDEAEAKLRQINQASNFTKPRMKIVIGEDGLGHAVPCEVVEVKMDEPDEQFPRQDLSYRRDHDGE